MEWRISSELVDYPAAVAEMEARAQAIREGAAEGLAWLLVHPPLYTAGTSAKGADLLQPRFPVHQSGRGGQYTYHGPGQRVGYVMLDLKALFAPRPPDLRAYIQRLENWIIASLAEFGLEGFTREGRVGVWVIDKGQEKKIAAIGVRVRHWVTYHGVCINVHPDLTHYDGIVPCGIREYGVTSLEQLGVTTSMQDMDAALEQTFAKALCA